MKSILEFVPSTGDIVKDLDKRCFFVDFNGWVTDKSPLFYPHSISDNTNIHSDDNGIYAMSIFFQVDEHVEIWMLEVNVDKRHKGFGKKSMSEIAKKTLYLGIHEIRLKSLDEESDKFYNSIGMEFQHNEFVGEFDWLRNTSNQ